MLWQYITDRYKAGEPIIASDIEMNICFGRLLFKRNNQWSFQTHL